MERLLSWVAVILLICGTGTFCSDPVQGQHLNDPPRAVAAEALLESPDVVAKRAEAFSSNVGPAGGVSAQLSVAAVTTTSVTPQAISLDPTSKPSDKHVPSTLLLDQQGARPASLSPCTDNRSDFCKRCNCNGTGTCGDDQTSSGCYNASSCWSIGYHSEGDVCWFCPVSYPYYSCGDHRCYLCPLEYPNFFNQRCWRCPPCFSFSYQDGQCYYVGPAYGNNNCPSAEDSCGSTVGCPSGKCRPRPGLGYAVCQNASCLSC